MAVINYDNKKLDLKDVRQEDILGMACCLSDEITTSLREKGICTPEVEEALENDTYDVIVANLEKLFNYPEFRSHN